MSNISEEAQSIINFLGCEYTHIPEGMEMNDVNDAYNVLFAERDGCIPVIVGCNWSVEFDSDQHSPDFYKTILSAPQVDVKKWFNENLKGWESLLSLDGFMDVDGGGDEDHDFWGFYDFCISKSMECVIANIPVTNPWEVLAWYLFRSRTRFPAPEVLLWIGKYWYEKFGAIPAVMTRDVLEFRAPPVKDRDTAVKLALEHFAFCSDIVYKAGITIGDLADSLTKSTNWHFRWDW